MRRGGGSRSRVRFERDTEDSLRRLDPQGTSFATLVGSLSAVRDIKSGGAVVAFTLSSVLGVDSLVLMRNVSLDPGSAQVLQSWSAGALSTISGLQGFTYADVDPSIVGQKVSYWVKVVPGASNSDAARLIGPQTVDATMNAGVVSAIADFDAWHSALSGGAVVVAISVLPPVADSKFGSVRIYATGYQGIVGKVLVAQSDVFPFTFKMLQTGETVTLTAVAVSKDGNTEASSGPTKVLTLGAAATVPAKIEIASALELTTGVQLSFLAGAETDTTQFLIYRGQRGGGFGAATNIGTVAFSAGNARYTYLDLNGLQGQFEWYVVTQNPTGNGAASAAITQGQAGLTSADIPSNAPSNATNTATVDSIDNGTNATIRVYGPGGVGSNYTQIFGYNPSLSRTPGMLIGFSYSTKYYIMRIAGGGAFQVSPTFAAAIPDGLEFVGVVTTIAAGGGGGTGGGGGGGAGVGGCVEEGTPVSYLPDSEVTETSEECSEWIELDVPNSAEPLRMHPDTLVSVFKKARDLQPGDLVEIKDGLFFECPGTRWVHKLSRKIKRIVKPWRTYFARGVRLHNMKYDGL